MAELPLEHLGSIVEIMKQQVLPAACPDEIFHYYSIPAFDGIGGPLAVEGSSIGSGKFLLTQPAVLVSKLNPRKMRVQVFEPSGHLRAVASTEFIVYVPSSRQIDLRYLFHTLSGNHFARRLQAVATGTTNSHVRAMPSESLGWYIPVPPLEEQRRIVEILDTIDEAIQATERVIAKHTAIRTGLAADLLSRISTMDDCEELPLGEVFDVQLGKMLGVGSRFGDQFQYLANRNVQWGRIVIDELGTMNFNIAERTRYRLQSGDLLVCEGGEVGRAAIWWDELPECYFQNAIHRLRAISDADPRYMRHYFEFAAMGGSLRALTGQTSIGHLPRANLVRWLVPMPPLEEQRRIAEILDTADEAIRVHEKERDKLKQFRSGLAADLLSGRVRTVSS